MYTSLRKICIDVLGHALGDNTEIQSGIRQIKAAYDFLVYDELRDASEKELLSSCAAYETADF